MEYNTSFLFIQVFLCFNILKLLNSKLATSSIKNKSNEVLLQQPHKQNENYRCGILLLMLEMFLCKVFHNRIMF